MTAADDRLILALDVPNALEGLALAEKLGDTVSFYKIGLGMLTGGGLALANELKHEQGKRIFLDMKLFDIGAFTIEPGPILPRGKGHRPREMIHGERQRQPGIGRWHRQDRVRLGSGEMSGEDGTDKNGSKHFRMRLGSSSCGLSRNHLRTFG